MGMFDSIYPEKAWCPLCGYDLKGGELQTKEGSCDLATYHSYEEFGNTVPNLYSFEVHDICPGCDEYISFMVPNNSPAAKAVREAERLRWQKEDEERVQKNMALLEAEHPHHKAVATRGMNEEPIFPRSCPKCVAEGYDGDKKKQPDNLYWQAWQQAEKKREALNRLAQSDETHDWESKFFDAKKDK